MDNNVFIILTAASKTPPMNSNDTINPMKTAAKVHTIDMKRKLKNLPG